MGLFDFMNIMLNLPPLIAILAISGGVSLITTVIYKFTTNQKLMKEIKDDIKRIQGEIKATKDTATAATLQKDMMKRSMQQFSSSTKSMLITLVPLFLLFGWMGSHLANEPISPEEEFTTTMHFYQGTIGQATLKAEGMELISNSTQQIAADKATWKLKAAEPGRYNLTYAFEEETYTTSVIVSKKQEYDDPVMDKKDGIKEKSPIEKITTDLRPTRPFGNFSIFGYMPGWIMTYFIITMAVSIALRKLLNIH